MIATGDAFALAALAFFAGLVVGFGVFGWFARGVVDRFARVAWIVAGARGRAVSAEECEARFREVESVVNG